MSDEMVKRIARKLAELDGRDPDDTDGGPCHMGVWLDEGERRWTGYEDAAKELIEAMRAPSREQEQTMDRLLGPDTPPTRRWHWVWQEMIDAALGKVPA